MKKAFTGPKQRSAFRNNYLAAVITVAALFSSFSSLGQSGPTRSELQQVNAKGYDYQSGAYRKLFYVPEDTLSTADSGSIAWLNSILYMKDRTKWTPWGKAVQITDSSFRVGLDTIIIRGTGGGVASLKNAGTGYRLVLIPDSIRSIRFAGTWIFGDTTSDRQELRIGVDPQVGYGLNIAPVTDVVYVDTNEIATPDDLTRYQRNLYWVNVIDHGADSTGATSSVTAFRNAIASLKIGGVLYVPAGNYFMDDSVLVDKPITMLGDGCGKSADGGGAITRIFTDDNHRTLRLFYITKDNFIIRNIGFQYVGDVGGDTALLGSKALEINTYASGVGSYYGGFLIDHCTFAGFFDNVDVVNGYQWTIMDTRFFSAQRYNLQINSLQVPDGGDHHVTNCEFIQYASQTGSTGIHHLTSGGLRITGSKFNGPLTYGYYGQLSGTSIIQISNSSFENYVGSAIKCLSFPLITVSGCEFASYNDLSGGASIDLESTQAVSITGNVFQKNASGTELAISISNCTSILVDNAYRGWDVVGQAPVAILGSNSDLTVRRPASHQVLTAGTPTFNPSLGQNAVVTLSSNTTITFAGLASGDIGTIIAIQDATGGRTLSYSGYTVFDESTLNTAANGRTVLRYAFVGTGLNIWSVGGAGGGGGENLSTTLGLGNFTGPGNDIIFQAASGTNRDMEVGNASSLDNFPAFDLYPNSGTDASPTLRLFPRGNGFSATIKAQLAFFNTDGKADATNTELLLVRSTGTGGYAFNSLATGTGTVRPIKFQMNTTDAVTFNTDNSVTMAGLAGSGTRTVTADASGNLGTQTVGDLTSGAVKATLHIVSDADYTVASTDYSVLYSNMTAARTLTLPAASSHTNRILIIKNGGNGAFAINLSTAIRENTTTTTSAIGQGNWVTIQSDGSEWWIIQTK